MYRNILLTIVLVFISNAAHPLFASEGERSEEVIKLLTIGNSYTNNATQYLEALGESAGRTIELSKANLGGANLERHARHLAAYKRDSNDPEGRPYSDRKDTKQEKFSLVEALQSDEWDFITLQQHSFQSMRPESFEPYLGQLVEAIRQYAPQAKILLLQTWAYRRDHSSYQEEGSSPEDMFEKLRQTYDSFAAKYGFDVIPVGHAFQIARTMRHWHMELPDPNYNYEIPKAGELPNQGGSINVGWYWRVNRDTGKEEFALDASHANDAGRYLGACVFFEAITGANSRELAWRPDGLSERQAESLREAAHKALATRNLDTSFVSILNASGCYSIFRMDTNSLSNKCNYKH